MNDPTDTRDEDRAALEPNRDPLAELRAGTIIEGKHRIDRIIGRGGMGVVAAATHVHLNERVALKFLQVRDEDVAGDFRARFALEARVCAKLRNEHIARVHDVGIWNEKVPFMVMEYLEGADLRRFLRDGAKLPLAQAVHYAVQICDGLAEAHAQGIVHRDLKPANVFITKRQDGTELVKVLDFGISKWTNAEESVDELTKTGMMLGSPKYMSPEQLNGDAIDARADVWSIGALLYQMLTGCPPYDFPQVTQTFMAIASGAPPLPPTTIEPSIPAAVEALIGRCLTRDKDARVQNVAELAGALLEAVDSPFAIQARAQIGATLDPAGALSNRAGPLSQTTGSYAVFSMTSTDALPSAEAIAAREASTPSAAPVRATRFGARSWRIAGSAVALVALVALAKAAQPSEASAVAAEGAPSAKVVALKELARDRATTLVARSTPASATAPSTSYAPARRATPSVKASPEPVAPVVAPSAPAPAPAAPPSRAAIANPLEDRQ